MERTVVYYDTTGPNNTDVMIDLAVQAATGRGIETIVVASRTGATASP